MDTPSVRSSGNKGLSKFRAIPIEQALLEKAKHFLESYQFDPRIRQHLHADKMENSIGKQKYYILGNEQKYEPGYILVMKGSPVIFVQGRLQFGFTLRLRLHASLYQNQAIFVGTLDTIQASLRLEDVLLYEGKYFAQEPFSKRYDQLQQFFNNAFVQDTRLSGLTVSVATLSPLSKLKSIVESYQFYSLDFVPEQPSRRRLVLQLQQQKQPTVAKTNVELVKQETKVVEIPKEERTVAMAFKIKGLPDTYELRDEVGKALGKAAVQTTELSQLLRQTIQNDGKQVKVQWHEEFERFKIVGLSE